MLLAAHRHALDHLYPLARWHARPRVHEGRTGEREPWFPVDSGNDVVGGPVGPLHELERRLRPSRPAVAALGHAADAVFVLRVIRGPAPVIHEQPAVEFDHRHAEISRPLPGLVVPEHRATGDRLMEPQARAVQAVDERVIDEELPAGADRDRRNGFGGRQLPLRPEQRAFFLGGRLLVADGKQAAVGEFDRGGIAEVEIGAVGPQHPVALPRLSIIAADRHPLAEGFFAIAVGHHERARRMSHEMRWRSAETHPPRHRPGRAAVIGERLHDRERRHAGASAAFLDPDRGDEPARGQLDDVRLVVAGRRRPRSHRHAADDPPGLAAVARAGGGDLADFHVLPGAEGFAEVEQIAVGELDRAVGRGDRCPAGLAPGLATVVGDTGPRADQPGDHVVVPVGEHLGPRLPLGGRNPVFLGIDPRVGAKP